LEGTIQLLPCCQVKHKSRCIENSFHNSCYKGDESGKNCKTTLSTLGTDAHLASQQNVDGAHVTTEPQVDSDPSNFKRGEQGKDATNMLSRHRALVRCRTPKNFSADASLNTGWYRSQAGSASCVVHTLCILTNEGMTSN
jgi:hypothetical protein